MMMGDRRPRAIDATRDFARVRDETTKRNSLTLRDRAHASSMRAFASNRAPNPRIPRPTAPTRIPARLTSRVESIARTVTDRTP